MAERLRRPVAEKATSFADVLASMKEGRNALDAWDDSLLADDIANISYEHALRSERARGTGSNSSRQAAASGGLAIRESKRRTASITIRVSQDEQQQLHERAAEAGLSISAYLRSCIFEAESLRTQVKQALLQMRAGRNVGDATSNTAPVSARRFGLFSRWTLRRRASA